MKVYELLSSKNNWTQGAGARNEYNDSIGVYNEKAIKWCLMGAVEKLYNNQYDEIRNKIMKNLSIRYASPVHFNDSSTYEDVIDLCKELDI